MGRITTISASPQRWSRAASGFLLFAAAVLFALVYVLRVIDGDAADGIGFLYTVPVALVALRFGWRGGIVAAVVGTLLLFLDSSAELALSSIGVATRISMLFSVGLLVGWFVDRDTRWQRLREFEQTKLRRFLELSQDMLCTADLDGYFVDLNPAWQRTLGFGEDELRAQPFVELVHPDDRERTAEEASKIFAGNTTVDFENRYLAKDGSIRWLRWSSVLGEDGMIYARATDATAHIVDAAKLRETTQELERSNEELRQFAYIASHDLNEPLRTISGFAQLLQKRYDDQVDEQGRDYIRRMVGGVGRMQVLISDLLRFSRAGHAEADPEPVDSEELVSTIVQDLEKAIADQGAEVRVGVLPTVTGDRNGLQQVFQNLISNAIKFTNGVAPVVEVEAESIATGWRFSISDNGIGIEQRQREKIFGAFERLHSRDDYAGTGIGLAICKKVVERHGGEIHVEDGRDGGSRFVFTILDPTTKDSV